MPPLWILRHRTKVESSVRPGSSVCPVKGSVVLPAVVLLARVAEGAGALHDVLAITPGLVDVGTCGPGHVDGGLVGGCRRGCGCESRWRSL